MLASVTSKQPEIYFVDCLGRTNWRSVTVLQSLVDGNSAGVSRPRRGVASKTRHRSFRCQSTVSEQFHFQTFSLRSQITTFKLAIRSYHVYSKWGAVAQWIERATDNRVVARSNPTETAWKLWQFPLPHFASIFRKRN